MIFVVFISVLSDLLLRSITSAGSVPRFCVTQVVVAAVVLFTAPFISLHDGELLLISQRISGCRRGAEGEAWRLIFTGHMKGRIRR